MDTAAAAGAAGGAGGGGREETKDACTASCSGDGTAHTLATAASSERPASVGAGRPGVVITFSTVALACTGAGARRRLPPSCDTLVAVAAGNRGAAFREEAAAVADGEDEIDSDE